MHQFKSLFQTQIYLVKVPLNVNIVKQDLLHKKQFLKILWSEVWKGRFQLMLILVLLGMYFNAVVKFVTSQTLLFRLDLAILWNECWKTCQPDKTTFSRLKSLFIMSFVCKKTEKSPTFSFFAKRCALDVMPVAFQHFITC